MGAQVKLAGLARLGVAELELSRVEPTPAATNHLTVILGVRVNGAAAIVVAGPQRGAPTWLRLVDVGPLHVVIVASNLAPDELKINSSDVRLRS